jgi:hypothetical protein
MTFTIDGDTVHTDSLGRYWYKYYINGKNKFYPTETRKYIVFKFRNQEIQIKNEHRKYFLDAYENAKLPIRYFDFYVE